MLQTLEEVRTVTQETITLFFEKCGFSSALYHTDDSVLFGKSKSLGNNNSNDKCHDFMAF